MTRLYMRLDVGFSVGDLNHVASLVKPWIRQQLAIREDWEGHRNYLSYEPKELPESGVCGVRIFYNRTTEGAVTWRLPHRQDLPTCAEIAVCGPDLLELGRIAARGRIACGDVLVIDGYVVGRSPADPTDAVLPRAHVVRFTPIGTAAPEDPTLMCHIAFGFHSEDLATASSVAGQLMQTAPVELSCEDLGGQYLRFTTSTFDALVRRNKISSVRWLYPRHQTRAWLLDVGRQTANLLELGGFALNVETNFSDQLSVLGYRVAGDLVKDRVPRLLSYDVEQRS
jgi:hypothetical protein